MDAQSRLDVASPKLLKEIEKYIRNNDQTPGYNTSLQIVKQTGNVFLSALDPFDLTFKMCGCFKQFATNTIQFGDLALVNRNGKHNSDTPVSNNCGKHQLWYNACVSTRLSNFSRSF